MQRDLARLQAEEHDVLVVGGGIHGAAAAWDAAQRGLRVALVEAADFGGGASWNSLKTIHGGLRHLQRADLAGLRESVRERRALLAIAPELVRPLPFLLPLRGHGTRGRAALSSRACAWSSARRSTMVVSATRPAAASTPTWRMPPPSCLRTRRAWPIRSAEPSSSEPAGAQRPLESVTITVSAPRASSAGGTPRATAAFQRRAPSRWTARPSSRQVETTSRMRSTVVTVPPARLCEFSTTTSPTSER